MTLFTSNSNPSKHLHTHNVFESPLHTESFSRLFNIFKESFGLTESSPPHTTSSHLRDISQLGGHVIEEHRDAAITADGLGAVARRPLAQRCQ